MRRKLFDSPRLGNAEMLLSAQKEKLLSVAREFDPLKVVRDHPFVTVGASALAGVVLGSGATAQSVGLAKLAAGAVSRLVPLITTAIHGFAAAHRQSAPEDAADPARPQPEYAEPVGHS